VDESCPACLSDVPHEHAGPLWLCPHQYGETLPGCCAYEEAVLLAAARVVRAAQAITRGYRLG